MRVACVRVRDQHTFPDDRSIASKGFFGETELGDSESTGTEKRKRDRASGSGLDFEPDRNRHNIRWI